MMSGARKGSLPKSALFDKVKATAATATEAAKDRGCQGPGEARRGAGQEGRRRVLRDLGAAFYATKTGRATPTTDADIDRLVASLQTHESEHGPITLAPESAAAAPTAAPAGDAPPPPPPPPAADRASPPPPPPAAQTL